MRQTFTWPWSSMRVETSSPSSSGWETGWRRLLFASTLQRSLSTFFIVLRTNVLILDIVSDPHWFHCWSGSSGYFPSVRYWSGEHACILWWRTQFQINIGFSFWSGSSISPPYWSVENYQRGSETMLLWARGNRRTADFWVAEIGKSCPFLLK